MKEKIYAIPVNDAFHSDCECPICSMRNVLEMNAIEYTMGPSYMEEDTRAMTDELGFCQKHMNDIRAMNNSLGMSLVLKTHFDKVITDVKKMSTKIRPKSFLKREKEKLPVVDYINKLNNSCFVCNRIDQVFDRYIDTIFFLWKTDDAFKETIKLCNGFCTTHYGVLANEASNQLTGNDLNEFIYVINELYISNMERVRDDLEWFINKFDYKYADEPWKNAKDSIQRAMTKTNSIL